MHTVNTDIYCRFVLLDAAKDVEAAELPLATFRSIYRPDLNTAVDRGGVGVDELESALWAVRRCILPIDIIVSYSNAV